LRIARRERRVHLCVFSATKFSLAGYDTAMPETIASLLREGAVFIFFLMWVIFLGFRKM
jgi:hypothetical protein